MIFLFAFLACLIGATTSETTTIAPAGKTTLPRHSQPQAWSDGTTTTYWSPTTDPSHPDNDDDDHDGKDSIWDKLLDGTFDLLKELSKVPQNGKGGYNGEVEKKEPHLPEDLRVEIKWSIEHFGNDSDHNCSIHCHNGSLGQQLYDCGIVLKPTMHVHPKMPAFTELELLQFFDDQVSLPVLLSMYVEHPGLAKDGNPFPTIWVPKDSVAYMTPSQAYMFFGGEVFSTAAEIFKNKMPMDEMMAVLEDLHLWGNEHEQEYGNGTLEDWWNEEMEDLEDWLMGNLTMDDWNIGNWTFGNSTKKAIKKPPKSVRWNETVSVRFVNKSNRTVDVFWIDYKGKEKKYKTLGPNQVFPQMTYVTHPWVFKDEMGKSIFASVGKKPALEKYFQPPAGMNRKVVDVYLHSAVSIKNFTKDDYVLKNDTMDWMLGNLTMEDWLMGNWSMEDLMKLDNWTMGDWTNEEWMEMMKEGDEFETDGPHWDPEEVKGWIMQIAEGRNMWWEEMMKAKWNIFFDEDWFGNPWPCNEPGEESVINFRLDAFGVNPYDTNPQDNILQLPFVCDCGNHTTNGTDKGSNKDFNKDFNKNVVREKRETPKNESHYDDDHKDDDYKVDHLDRRVAKNPDAPCQLVHMGGEAYIIANVHDSKLIHIDSYGEWHNKHAAEIPPEMVPWMIGAFYTHDFWRNLARKNRPVCLAMVHQAKAMIQGKPKAMQRMKDDILGRLGGDGLGGLIGTVVDKLPSILADNWDMSLDGLLGKMGAGDAKGVFQVALGSDMPLHIQIEDGDTKMQIKTVLNAVFKMLVNGGGEQLGKLSEKVMGMVKDMVEGEEIGRRRRRSAAAHQNGRMKNEFEGKDDYNKDNYNKDDYNKDDYNKDDMNADDVMEAVRMMLHQTERGMFDVEACAHVLRIHAWEMHNMARLPDHCKNIVEKSMKDPKLGQMYAYELLGCPRMRHPSDPLFRITRNRVEQGMFHPDTDGLMFHNLGVSCKCHGCGELMGMEYDDLDDRERNKTVTYHRK